MAHNIQQYDKHQGVKQGWHGLTEIKPLITLEDNWLSTWELRPIKLQKRGVDTKWTILECSDVPDLEIGSPYNEETFKPVDNKAFLELVKASINGTDHKIVSVGSIRNRGRVFLSVELAGMEEFKAGGRNFSAFLNFGNGHDKSSVLWVNTSNTCVVCDNTFSMNLFSVENKQSATSESDDIKLRQRHTKNVIMQLPAMAKLVEEAVGVQAQFSLAFKNLSSAKIALDEAKSLFAGFIGRKVPDVKNGLSTRSSNTVDRLVELHRMGKGNNGESLADAFSAVTDFYTHFSSGKGENPMRQYLSSEYGAGNVAKVDFWNLLTKGTYELNEVIERGDLLLTNTKD